MPRPRFHHLDAAKRDAIIHAAALEFATHGFDGASYNRIIEQAGFSKGAMYYYFDDKEDLYLTVVKHLLEEFSSVFGELPAVDSSEQFWAVVEERLLRMTQYAVERPVVMGVMRMVLKHKFEHSQSAPAQALYDYADRVRAGLFQLGRQVGAVRDDLPMELLLGFVSAVDEAFDRWLHVNYESVDPERMTWFTSIILDLIKRMVSPAGKVEPQKPVDRQRRSVMVD
jgi:AcrR family transcriptional regulator